MKIRKVVSVLFVSLAAAGFLLSCGSSRESSAPAASNSFIAPGYVKKDYKKILVLARLEQETYRKRIEKALVSEFKERRYNVVPSYDFLTPEMLKDSLHLRSRLEEMGFDAALVLTGLAQMTDVTEQYKYNGAMYSVFYGPYTSLDLETRSGKVVYFQCDFFVKDVPGTQWRAPVSVKLGDLDIAEQQLAIQARKRIQADKIL
jgi:hypothetical protein